jgi:hypothetical protein
VALEVKRPLRPRIRLRAGETGVPDPRRLEVRLEVGALQVRSREDGTCHIRAGKSRAAQICARHATPFESGVLEARAAQFCCRQRRTRQVGALEVGACEPRAFQVRALKMGIAEIGPPNVCSREIRAAKIRPDQARTDQSRASEVSVA